MISRKLLPLLISVLMGPVMEGHAQETSPAPVLQAQPPPPYFISYEITEDAVVTVMGSFGKIVQSVEDRRRQLDIDVRVGDYTLDNTRALRGDFPGFSFFDRFSLIQVPLEDDPAPLRAIL